MVVCFERILCSLMPPSCPWPLFSSPTTTPLLSLLLLLLLLPRPRTTTQCRTSLDDKFGLDGNCHFTEENGPYCYQVSDCQELGGTMTVCNKVDRTKVEPCRLCCRPKTKDWYESRWLVPYHVLIAIQVRIRTLQVKVCAKIVCRDKSWQLHLDYK